MKLTSLSSYMGGGKKGELGVGGWLRGPKPAKFDLERVFAKLPEKQVISDVSIDEIIDNIASLRKYETAGDIISRLMQGQASKSSGGTPKGELALLEATRPLEEGFPLLRPDGRSLPIVKKGSYLAHRKPFDKLPLFDGTYHSGFILDYYDISTFDLLKIYLKEGDGVDPAAVLGSWDNYHARIVGLIGMCPPYQCRFRPNVPQEPEWKISFGLFALVVDVSPFDDLDIAGRMSTWTNL